MNFIVFVISGKQGAGKTTLSKLLELYYSKLGYTIFRLRFAQPLYEMHDQCRAILVKYGIPVPVEKDGELLQLLGTEWGRKKDDLIWVKCLLSRLKEIKEMSGNQKIVVTIEDCRFENEFNAFSDVPGAIKIRLTCQRGIRRERAEYWRKNENHPSEVGLDRFSGIETIWWKKPLVKLGILNSPPNKFDMTFHSDHMSAEQILNVLTAHLETKA